MNDSQTVTDAEKPSLDFMPLIPIVVILVLLFAYEAIEKWWYELERRHARAERLKAYRLRHSWRKGDMTNLLSLGVNAPALRRMERLTGKGRPVVNPHQDLAMQIADKFAALHALADPDASPDRRRRAFRRQPWWPHYVEAVYRAEYERAKTRGISDTSAETELLVGRALGISASTVHRICGRIRRLRKEKPEMANCPQITIADYQRWMEGLADLREGPDTCALITRFNAVSSFAVAAPMFLI
jgi:hypothetical protein